MGVFVTASPQLGVHIADVIQAQINAQMSFNMVCDGLRALASWIYQKDYEAQMAREVE